MSRMIIHVALSTSTACASRIICAQVLFFPGISLVMHQISQPHLVRSANVLSQTRAGLPHELDNLPAMTDKHRAPASQVQKFQVNGVMSYPMISIRGLMLRLPYIQVDRKVHLIAMEDRW
jgi:hypothetical protein